MVKSWDVIEIYLEGGVVGYTVLSVSFSIFVY